MIADVFQDYSAYYDLLYREKDYAAEAEYVARLLRSMLPDSRNLLELGSGTGRHGRLLAEQGFQVVGVERSKRMMEFSSRNGDKASAGAAAFECILGDIRSVDLNRRFDAVISLFHVVSYQTSNSDVTQTFATAARHLGMGGIFLFDVWHGPAVLKERPSIRMKRIEDDSIRLTRVAEPELDSAANLVSVRYTMFVESKTNGTTNTIREEHRMRYYFPLEIDLLANQAGFAVERSEEFLSGKPPGEDTWGVAYLLRKIK